MPPGILDVGINDHLTNRQRASPAHFSTDEQIASQSFGGPVGSRLEASTDGNDRFQAERTTAKGRSLPFAVIRVSPSTDDVRKSTTGSNALHETKHRLPIQGLADSPAVFMSAARQERQPFGAGRSDKQPLGHRIRNLGISCPVDE